MTKTPFRFHAAPWQRLHSALVLENRWLTVRQDTCALPNGAIVDDYFVLVAPEVACVVALTADRQVVLVEQYKHGIGRPCLEIPGGAFEAAEGDPLAVAQRELREETGYVSDRWLPLGVLPISPSRTTEQMHLFAALDCERVDGQHLDPQEDITVHLRPLPEALALVRAGVIDAATSVAGLLLATADLRDRGLLE